MQVRLALAIAMALLVDLPTLAQTTMSHEETMVRTAYAKLAYAVQQHAIGDLAMESDGRPSLQKQHVGMTSDQRLAAAQLSFTLSDFVIGDVRDILNRKALDLISPAVGEELASGGDTGMSYSDLGLAAHWECLEVQWRAAHVPPPEVFNLTIADIYRLQWHVQRPENVWQHYASYSVTVSYQGKSRGPYKALFLFGHDEKGNEVIEPEDSTTSVTGLADALHQHLFPDAFVLTRLRNLPVVANWLNANQMSGPTCSVGQRDVCCDLLTLKCGPGRADVAEGLSKALPDGSLLKR